MCDWGITCNVMFNHGATYNFSLNIRPFIGMYYNMILNYELEVVVLIRLDYLRL